MQRSRHHPLPCKSASFVKSRIYPAAFAHTIRSTLFVHWHRQHGLRISVLRPRSDRSERCMVPGLPISAGLGGAKVILHVHAREYIPDQPPSPHLEPHLRPLPVILANISTFVLTHYRLSDGKQKEESTEHPSAASNKTHARVSVLLR